MFGDAGEGQGEWAADVAYGCLAGGEAGEDGAAGGVGEGVEDPVQVLLFNHVVEGGGIVGLIQPSG